MTDVARAEPSRRETAALAATLVAVLLVFLPALRCGFTSWDDPAFCVANPDVADPNLLRIFDPHNWVVGDWTPLVTLSYAAERALFGPDPWVPHTTNVLLHVAAVYLVHRLLREIGFGAWESLGVAVLYGVHPFQVESVAWVASRKNVLMAVFTLSCIRSYLAGHHVRATGWLALSLCSKATAVGFPLIAAAAQAMGIGTPRPRRTWVWIGIWTGMSIARASVSMAAQAFTVGKLASNGFGGRMAYMGSVLSTQIRQFFAPTDLSVIYDPPRRAWDDPVLLGQWALVAAVLTGAVLLARRDRRLAWVGVFGLVVLGPTLNVFPGPCWQADRYLQLPLVAIGAFLIAALAPLGRVRPWAPAAPFLVWIGAVCVPLTIERQAVWKDDDALWLDTRTKTPTSSVAWDWTALALAQREQFHEAIPAFRRALELDPGNTAITLNLAISLFGDHQDFECERVVADVIRQVKDDERSNALWGGEAHGLLGGLRARAGRLEEASAEFAEALRLSPSSARVRGWADQFAARSMRPR